MQQSGNEHASNGLALAAQSAHKSAKFPTPAARNWQIDAGMDPVN